MHYGMNVGEYYSPQKMLSTYTRTFMQYKKIYSGQYSEPGFLGMLYSTFHSSFSQAASISNVDFVSKLEIMLKFYQKCHKTFRDTCIVPNSFIPVN